MYKARVRAALVWRVVRPQNGEVATNARRLKRALSVNLSDFRLNERLPRGQGMACARCWRGDICARRMEMSPCWPWNQSEHSACASGISNLTGSFTCPGPCPTHWARARARAALAREIFLYGEHGSVAMLAWKLKRARSARYRCNSARASVA